MSTPEPGPQARATGPDDYTVSMGSKDKTLVEFKLATNTKLKQNLLNQLEIYQKANETQSGIKVIFFFTDEELKRVKNILGELRLEESDSLVLIDLRPKESASRARN